MRLAKAGRRRFAALAAAVVLMGSPIFATPAAATEAPAPVGSSPEGAVMTAETVSPLAASSDEPNLYNPIQPSRFADTRIGEQFATIDGAGPKGAVRADQTTTVPIASRGSPGSEVPATDVGAVVVSLTATGGTANTYITAYPTGSERPGASNLNPSAGQTVANMAIVPVGADGSITLYNAKGTTELIVDVLGWIPRLSDYNPMTPQRFADTRIGEQYPTIDGAGPRGTVGPDMSITVPLSGRGGLTDPYVGAVVVNLTATGGTANTYVTAYPTGAEQPTASNLNPAAGQTVANMAIVPVGADGSITLYNNTGSTELIVDVLGWFPTGADYKSMSPARFADTRIGAQGPFATVDGTGPQGAVGTGLTTTVAITGRAGIPATGVGAVVVNLTATGGTASTYITAYPSGTERPTASNLNPARGQTVANMAIVPVGGDGSITLFNARGSIELIVDVLGWFPATTTPPAASQFVFSAAASDYPDTYPGGWGRNNKGQLGDGTSTSPRTTAVLAARDPLLGSQSIRTGSGSVSGGNDHNCAVTTGGKVYCAGGNDYGQLGDGTRTDSLVPVEANFAGLLAADEQVVAVRLGDYHSCAMTEIGSTGTGNAYCWGRNNHGQLGNGTSGSGEYSALPVKVSMTGDLSSYGFTWLSSGGWSTCGVVTDGSTTLPICWGYNDKGQLGNGTTTSSSVPVQVNTGVLSGETPQNITVGFEHACLRTAAGNGYCWGWNLNGQLGNGTKTNSSTPVAVSHTAALPAASVANMTAGYRHTCATTTTGTSACWGEGAYGRLGTGDTADSTVPAAVDATGALSGKTVSWTAAGDFHSCALMSDGTAACWGRNNYGQLGNGTTSNSLVPILSTALASSNVAQLGNRPITYLHATQDTTIASFGYSTRPGTPAGPAIGDVGGKTTLSWTAPTYVGFGTLTYNVYYKSTQTNFGLFAEGVSGTSLDLTTNATTGCSGATSCPRLYGGLVSGTTYQWVVVPKTAPAIAAGNNLGRASTPISHTWAG